MFDFNSYCHPRDKKHQKYRNTLFQKNLPMEAATAAPELLLKAKRNQQSFRDLKILIPSDLAGHFADDRVLPLHRNYC